MSIRERAERLEKKLAGWGIFLTAEEFSVLGFPPSMKCIHAPFPVAALRDAPGEAPLIEWPENG